MSDYVILADSCMDLSAEQRKQYNIEKPVPGSILYPDGSDHQADIDWEEMTFEEFYRHLDKKENFKTGLPNQYLIGQRVEEYFKEGKDIIAVTLSSGMSGTYNSFLLTKREMEEKYPERHLYVVDSKRYSGGISILCVLASMNREKGMSAEENFKFLEEKKKCIHQVGIIDNLFFLQRSGRISKAKAFFGTMAGVKPMADFSNETGMPAVLGNARGYKASYKIVEEMLKALNYTIAVDGIFGLKTYAAVRDFQSKNGLVVDGIVGPKTLTALEKATSNSNDSYQVKITASLLNVRSDAGITNPIVGMVRKNSTYTILQTKEGWGKISSPSGWICLDYTEKI